jgi:tetratricopeptide (TPR) repeat protein
MWNVALAVVTGLLAFAVLLLSPLTAYESTAPAVLVVIVAYFLLARRAFKKVEAIFNEASKSLTAMPPKLELAVSTLEKAYTLAPWQLGVRSQVDTQIGVIYFLQQEFKKAQPYLERSKNLGHWLGGAMLGVIQYKRKEHDAMRQTLDVVVKRAKSQGLAWTLYAYLLLQIGDREGAQKLLVTAVKRTKDDQKVKEALLAVQNGKKINMRAYKEQWYQFHLERPPQQQSTFMPGGRLSKLERRGRW